MKNNQKGNTAIIILLVVLIAIGAYIAFKPKENILPEAPIVDTESTPVTQTQVSTDQSKKVEVSNVPSGLKLFTGHGGISISAPSTMKVTIDSEHNGEILFDIESSVLGGISIDKYASQIDYNKQVPSDLASQSGVSLVNANYSVNGIPAKLYLMKDPGGINANIILIPSVYAVILVTPEGKAWSGYSESDVTKMIQSIKF